VASGGVQAKSLGAAGGSFGADRVEIALTPNAAGEAQPRTLLATGNVMAGDDAQTMWASTLRATFVEAKAKPGAAAKPATKPSADAKAARDDAGGMKSDLGEIVAEGPVELAEAHGRGRAVLQQRLGETMGRRTRIGRIGPRGQLHHQVEVRQAPERITVHPMQQQIPHGAAHDGQHGAVGRPMEGGQQTGRQGEIPGIDRADRHQGRPMERCPEGARYTRATDIVRRPDTETSGRCPRAIASASRQLIARP
jgi:hypothetical protein